VKWGRHLPALGTMGVHFEERVDYRGLYKYRIGRVPQALENSELGALITFDVKNMMRSKTKNLSKAWHADPVQNRCAADLSIDVRRRRTVCC
jgi:Xaa-Pro dipeptidase